jgi:hypothetical protein
MDSNPELEFIKFIISFTEFFLYKYYTGDKSKLVEMVEYIKKEKEIKDDWDII